MKIKINKTFDKELSADQLHILESMAKNNNSTPAAFLSLALCNYIDTNFVSLVRDAVLKDDNNTPFLDKCDCTEHGNFMEVGSKISDAFSWPKQVIRHGVKWNFMQQYGLDLKELGKYTGKAVYTKDDDTKNSD